MEKSVCGYDCSDCIIAKATKNNDKKTIQNVFKINEDQVEEYQCLGCLSTKIGFSCKNCFIKDCALSKKRNSCSECETFPCEYLKENLSKNAIENLRNMKNKQLMNRVSVIGMCGNSCFYDVKNGISTLVHEEVGGKGYNQAVAICRFKTKVSFLAAIGNDKNGDLCEEFMRSEGADCFFIRKNNPTLEANIYVDEQGNNDVQYSTECVAKLDRKDVQKFECEIANSDFLLLQYEYDKEVIEEAIAIAKKHHVKVVVNPAPMIYKDINLIKDADIITPNELEARTLFDANRNYSFDNIIEKEQKSPFQMVINTLGSDGIMLVMKEKQQSFEAIKVKAIDTTGAGDTFNGVFIASLAQGNELTKSIQNGIIASGLSVTKKYVMDAIPKYDDIIEYRKNHF